MRIPALLILSFSFLLACGGDPNGLADAGPQDAGPQEDGAPGFDADVLADAGPSPDADLMESFPRDPYDILPDIALTPVGAPAIALTHFVSFHEANRFIYESSLQTGVAANTINPLHMAVIRGQVFSRALAPLENVVVTVAGHPEYGQTLTRSDGRFDLAVNGGATLSVSIEGSGFLQATRTTMTAWGRHALVKPTILVALDTVTTTVAMGNGSMQVARASTVTDINGARQSTLLFPANVGAVLRMPDGSTRPTAQLTVRATEYTLGATGFFAVPAPLPPASEYTHLVEFSADEVDSMGASSVEFDAPVISYLENYLDFPVGAGVPSAYYDREATRWVPTPNGRVLQIVEIAAGLATLDLDDDGVAEDATALLAAGIDADEQQALAQLYAAGQELWRVEVEHFTPFDFNRLEADFASPFGAIFTGAGGAKFRFGTKKECEAKGSVIDISTQVLGEDLALAGTTQHMHYRSDRVSGGAAGRVLTVPVPVNSPQIGEVIYVFRVAGTFTRVRLDLETYTEDFYEFEWDGRDSFGRLLSGTTVGSIDYIYLRKSGFSTVPAANVIPGTLGSPSGVTDNQNTVRFTSMPAIVLGPTRTVSFFQPHEESTELGGWDLTDYHHYDPVGRDLYLGSGGVLSSEGISQVNAIAGAEEGNCFSPFDSCTGALDFAFDAVEQVLALPDGRVLFSTGASHCQVFVRDDVGVSVFAGRPCQAGSAFGEAVQATSSDLVNPTAMARGLDGSIYIVDQGRHTIRVVDSQGLIHTAVGTGSPGTAVDGATASAAAITSPMGVAIAPGGDLYFTESDLHRVRFVGADGLLRTLGGNGLGFAGDEGPVWGAQFNRPSLLAFDPEGSLLIADVGNQRLRKVSRAGFLTTHVGAGAEGQLAAITLPEITGLASGPEGQIALVSNFGEVRVLLPSEDSTDGLALASTSGIAVPRTGVGVAFGPAGNLLVTVEPSFSDLGPPKRAGVLSAAAALPGVSTDAYLIPDPSGNELFEFDLQGRHLRTLDLWTGAAIWEFDHDASGRLTVLRDLHGQETLVDRDTQGQALAVIGPEGQRNDLSFVDGALTGITFPSGDAWNMSYLPGLLLSSITAPTGAQSVLDYDSIGRLISDTDADGVTQSLARVGSDVTHSLPSGALTTYTKTARGLKQTLEVTAPDGSVRTAVTNAAERSTEVTMANGTVVRRQMSDDLRLGAAVQRVTSMEVDIPTGLGPIQYQATSTQFLTGTGAGGLLDYDEVRSLDSINGRNYTTIFDFQSRTESRVSPLGRRQDTTMDSTNNIVSSEFIGLTPTTYSYDAQGRLATSTTGTRDWSAGYDAESNLVQWTSPDGESVAYQWDEKGKLIGKTLKDGRQLAWTYDEMGRLTSATPPGRSPYLLSYSDAGNLLQSSDPSVPLADGIVDFSHDVDGKLVRLTLPNNNIIDFIRDDQSGGRISQILHGGIAEDYSYDAAGRLETSSAAGLTVNYGYSGALATELTYSGAFSASVAVLYNNNIQPSMIVAGALVGLGYDQDGLLTQAGALSLSRDASTGLVDGSSLGQVSTSASFNGFAEMDTYAAQAGATALWDVARSFDSRSLISEAVDTVLGTSAIWGYQYDLSGRLQAATINAQPSYDYVYDDNGNLTSSTTPNGVVAAVYDGRDRLVSATDTSFTYDSAGALASMTVAGNQVTTYQHSLRGALERVVLPDNTVIEYLSDTSQHRVGRLVDGALTAAWPRDPFGRVASEVNAAGDVVATFIYGESDIVPDAMIRGGVTYRLLHDYRNSVRFVVDSSDGTIVQELQYDPYGQVLVDTNPGFQPFGFAGGLYDPLTSLVRIGVREYDPQFGRFTSIDPLGFASGSMNLYRYANNDPVNVIDDGGYTPVNVGGAIIGAIIGGIFNGLNAMSKPGGSFLKGAAIGAAAGAIAGFALNPLLAGAIIGALTEVGNILAGITVICSIDELIEKVGTAALAGLAGAKLGTLVKGASLNGLNPASLSANALNKKLIGTAVAENLASGKLSAELGNVLNAK